MHVNNSNSNKKCCTEDRNPAINTNILKFPDVFRKGMDGKSWMTVMESFLKDFDKSEWVRVAVSYIENQILKQFANLESFLKDHENGFDQFKTAFLRLVVPQAALTQSISNWTKLNEYKQRQNQSIWDNGQSTINLVNSVFPNLEGSIDLDHIIKERFVEGLFNVRLREVARTKMHKRRVFKPDEFFGI
ncbi:hypothetical protein BpHYR1_005370 [Brachionus plicatilis]|uniref:Uncharacterized protein n=1 Tax=Brachionus plicatilis TaxID=10195 RepID=A0A3M7PM79_BRAPC|nr:hypothetical protein BpHYR1_005370 [Brachionus plicatilis]